MQTKIDTIETGMNARPTTLLIVLHSLLDSQGMLTEERDCARFTTGARYGCGQTLAVLRPENHEQVVQIVALCVKAGQALVLQGANTGLVTASTSDSSGHFMVWPDESDVVPRYDADVVQLLRTEIYDLAVNR